MKDFIAANNANKKREVAEDDVTVFNHWGTEVAFIRPSEGQFLMMLAMGGRNMDLKTIGNFIHLFIELGDPETQRHFQTLLLDQDSDFSVRGPGGIFDIWENLVKEWSGKASPKPAVSQESASETTPISTARSRRSISYRSPSEESSTLS